MNIFEILNIFKGIELFFQPKKKRKPKNKKKTNKEIKDILVRVFYGSSREIPNWIQEYAVFNYNHEEEKVELTISLKKINLEEGMFWEEKNEKKQLVKIDVTTGKKSYYISFDRWEYVTIFKTYVDIITLETKILIKKEKLNLLNKEDYFS